MKKTLLALSLVLLYSFSMQAQTEAVTANGDTVLLFDDGRWDYKTNLLNEGEEEAIVELPPLNPEKFTKPKSAKETANGKYGAYEIWYDAKKWDRKISKTGGESDIELHRKNGEGFAMTIFERAEFPLSALREVALSNARDAATEFEVKHEEMRTVNGRQVLCLKFNATIQGVKFTYFGYYCSFPGGTLQVLTMTFQNLFNEFEPDFKDLLNGLIVKE